MQRKLFLCLFLVTALGGVAFAQQQDTSLADVVRQHKTTRKAARVITNDDIPSRPDDSASTPAATGSADANAAAKADDSRDAKSEAPADKARDDKAEKKDSPEVAALKSRLDQLNKDADNLHFDIKGMETQLSNENDDERRTILENAIKNRNFSLQQTVLEREDVTGKLQELQKPKTDQQ